jgi:hypothetical protein
MFQDNLLVPSSSVNPEELRSHLHCGGSLKWCNDNPDLRFLYDAAVGQVAHVSEELAATIFMVTLIIFSYLLVIFKRQICWVQTLLLFYCFNSTTACIQTTATKSNTTKCPTFSSSFMKPMAPNQNLRPSEMVRNHYGTLPSVKQKVTFNSSY